MDELEKEFVNEMKGTLAKLKEKLEYIEDNKSEWIEKQKKLCENRIQQLPEREAQGKGNRTPINNARAQLMELEARSEYAFEREKQRTKARIESTEKRLDEIGD